MKIEFFVSVHLVASLLFSVVRTDNRKTDKISILETTLHSTSAIDLLTHVTSTSSAFESTSATSEESTDLIIISTEFQKLHSTDNSSVSPSEKHSTEATPMLVYNETDKDVTENPEKLHNVTDLLTAIIKEITTQKHDIHTEDISHTEGIVNTTVSTHLKNSSNEIEDDRINEISDIHDHKVDKVRAKKIKLKYKPDIGKIKHNYFDSKINKTKYELTNITNDIIDAPECYLALSNITKMNQSKEGLPIGIEIPVCREDGTFSSKQCSLDGLCRCVSKNGTPITEPKQGELFCDCLRERHDNNISVSDYFGHIPECDENGYFKPKQCMVNSTLCWCLSKEGVILTEPLEDITDCHEAKIKKVDNKNSTIIEKYNIPNKIK